MSWQCLLIRSALPKLAANPATGKTGMPILLNIKRLASHPPSVTESHDWQDYSTTKQKFKIVILAKPL